jgi:NADH dehydrogenase FAD-containing subunit
MRILVVGGGFGGLEVIGRLERRLRARTDVELVLVSDKTYLLFTPLLPQVASSLVEPRHILQPIRDIRGRRRFRFRRDRVGFRKQVQVALDWWLAGLFSRDTAIMREPRRCPVCTRVHARGETWAA